MKRVIVITITLGLVLGAGVAFAGGHGFGHHRGMKAMGPGGHAAFPMMRGLTRLNLSESQRNQVEAIMDEVRPKLEAHRRAMRDIRGRLQDLDPGTFDEKTVRELTSQLSEHMTEMVVLRQQTRARIHAVLTPEQQQQLQELRQQREARRQRMRGCMGGAGGPGELPSPPPAE